MKTQIAFVVVVMVSIIMGFQNNLSNQFGDNILVATYMGITEYDQFEFADSAQNSDFFDNVLDDLEINLYDEENIGNEYIVSWKEEQVDLLNEEGEETGEIKIIKTITDLEEISIDLIGNNFPTLKPSL